MSIRAAIPLFAALVAAAPANAQRLPGAAPLRPGATNEPVPALEGVGIDEQTGESVPRDVMFRDETGAPVAFGSLLDGERPVLLTFYYSRCPMLCSVQLGDLVDVLNKSPWVVGDKFRIVSISLDPTETYRTAFDTKEGYLDRYKAPEVPGERRLDGQAPVDSRTAIAQSWKFLTGDQEAIDALTEAVGFEYNYVAAKREYAHPTAIIVLTPTGTIASYLHGLSYEADDLSSRVISAALEQPSESTAQFVYSCFHFVEPSGFTAVALQTMRYAGILFVGLLAGGLIFLHRRRRRQRDRRHED